MTAVKGGAPPGKAAIAILVFAGMTASGKSTLGQVLAQRYQVPYHNSDRIRKELAGLQATERRPDQVGAGIYSTAFTEATYQAMLDRVRDDSAHGAAVVILDGSYSRRRYRDAVRGVARDLGGSAVFIFCICPDDEVRRRLEQRAKDSRAVSDGRWEIYLHQKKTYELPDALEEGSYILLDTERPVERLVTDLEAHPYMCGLLPPR
ncbi:AAA family ATPase [Desulfobulbus alkaliphilus]|uniref:AAA family ATPase n=1 Tax=Desulfobulbus alkaliphilus TaxID=869814 RepID=UPI0019636A39|nr:ATP-binding protein [Desulfobulbus alkaliphilus]MBM9536840.1 ATP-binding protein [Desulfobulbus alkaliphilus]